MLLDALDFHLASFYFQETWHEPNESIDLKLIVSNVNVETFCQRRSDTALDGVLFWSCYDRHFLRSKLVSIPSSNAGCLIRKHFANEHFFMMSYKCWLQVKRVIMHDSRLESRVGLFRPWRWPGRCSRAAGRTTSGCTPPDPW